MFAWSRDIRAHRALKRLSLGVLTGVVMHQFQLTADRAFELLTRVSRIHDVTLEALAEQILDEVTNPPTKTDDGPTESLP